MKIEYATAADPFGRHRRVWLRTLVVVAGLNLASYVACRMTGTLYPFYNQGTWDAMDGRVPGWVHLAFLPLSELELAYHNRFTPAPSGG